MLSGLVDPSEGALPQLKATGEAPHEMEVSRNLGALCALNPDELRKE
jgi:hypothetical protein